MINDACIGSIPLLRVSEAGKKKKYLDRSIKYMNHIANILIYNNSTNL